MAKKDPRIFGDQLDVFGNTIDLFEDTWNIHILQDGHPDMVGHEHLVLKVLKDPEMVCESTQYHYGLAYISAPGIGPRPEGIRVLVQHSSAEYLKGSSYGFVTTAYPIDLQNYEKPRIKLNTPIYRKPRK